MPKDLNVNAELVAGGSAVGDSNPLPVKKDIKGTTLALFGGAIAASVLEADATVIDMRKYTKGSLRQINNSGAGTWSFAIVGSDVATGVFTQVYQEKSDKSGIQAKPAIVTVTNVAGNFELANINCNYIKLVPTLTSTNNSTFSFTPVA